MKITGIICEYNPLHLGHKKQLDKIRAENPQGATVCIMSGNFVQRGKPAVFHKQVRAKAAVCCGADLVLELPVTGALSSAEGFAAQGVKWLGSFCDYLSFGAETADTQDLMSTAQALLEDPFPEYLRAELQKGLSFPAARQAALSRMGLDGKLLETPNNILAVEYCKAILTQNSRMLPRPILREGNYHDTKADPQNPSATSLRLLMDAGENWTSFVPREALPVYRDQTRYDFSVGERAILAKLRTMTNEEYEKLPGGSEGLWRKLMHAARQEASLEDILSATKSKRYTRSRLDRMVLCAFLGITRQDLVAPVPYCRVLALNDTGRQVLKLARENGRFINAGETADDPHQLLENRCGALYELFAKDRPGLPNTEARQRIYYQNP